MVHIEHWITLIPQDNTRYVISKTIKSFQASYPTKRTLQDRYTRSTTRNSPIDVKTWVAYEINHIVQNEEGDHIIKYETKVK